MNEKTIKQIIGNTIKKILMSRKGLTWLSSYVMQIVLTIQLAFYSTFGNPEKVKYIFWLILANMLIQLITLGLIAFEKIKISINK